MIRGYILHGHVILMDCGRVRRIILAKLTIKKIIKNQSVTSAKVFFSFAAMQSLQDCTLTQNYIQCIPPMNDVCVRNATSKYTEKKL